MIKARERFALDKIVKWATFTLPEGVPAAEASFRSPSNGAAPSTVPLTGSDASPGMLSFLPLLHPADLLHRRDQARGVLGDEF